MFELRIIFGFLAIWETIIKTLS